MHVRFLHTTSFNIAVVVVVSALDAYANAHQQRWGNWLAIVLFASYATYCVQNFVRCREVHCAVTAPGFLAATVLMLLRAAAPVRYEYGVPWLVFAASACVGYCVQFAYKARTGSSFLK
jgi:uncharacterized membrane protein (DUF2068 family)